MPTTTSRQQITLVDTNITLVGMGLRPLAHPCISALRFTTTISTRGTLLFPLRFLADTHGRRNTMGRGLLLWLIGIPIPIILIVWLLGGLHG